MVFTFQGFEEKIKLKFNLQSQVCGIYVAGVVSGSLATSLTDPQALLAGASGSRDSTFRTVPQVLEISGHGGSKWVMVAMI